MPVKSLYTVYCIEENAQVSFWSYELPTECPNIHNDRTIDPDLTMLNDQVTDHSENLQLELTSQPLSEQIDVLITSFFFNYERMDMFSQISFFSHMSVGGDSYTVSLYDLTNRILLGSQTFTNTEPQINVINNLTNFPNDSADFEIRCKVNGNTKVFIKNITVFYHEHTFRF